MFGNFDTILLVSCIHYVRVVFFLPVLLYSFGWYCAFRSIFHFTMQSLNNIHLHVKIFHSSSIELLVIIRVNDYALP